MDAAFYTEYARLERTHWWFAARRRILAQVLDGLRLPAGIRVLEAGCGTGGNLALLARYGTLDAMEMDARACGLASGQGAVVVKQGRLPDEVPFEENTYGLVALLDVLEHVEQDREALDKLFRLLQPGGTLLVTVPAFMFLWSRHDVINHHFRRYRRGPLVRLLREAGFEVTHATYFNTLLFPLVAGARFFNNARARVTGRAGDESDATLPASWVNRLLERIFASERFAAPHLALPFGVSILAVARRPGR